MRDSKPCGDVVVAKEECIGHVQKRVSGRLRKLKSTMKGQKLADGKPLGGAGRLTDGTIDNLQTFYRLAIHNNMPDVKGTATAIFASLFRRASTNDKPLHMFCPSGASSWCG